MHYSYVMEIAIILIVIIAMGYAVFNFNNVKRALIGRPMRSRELHAQHNKLFWIIALPILSADLYSSVAYGPEAGMAELMNLGEAAKWFIIPITLSSIVLLAILILSYIMGVTAYPNGGGSYVIAKDNFRRRWPSLVSSSALLIDYVLTVAVSVSAGIAAIASAYPVIAPYETTLALTCVLILVLVNLRGIAESATIFAWPTFIFMGCMLMIIFTGFADEMHAGFEQAATPSFGTIPDGITTLLILKAFSSACSALTGIETISCSVPVFRNPRQKSVIKTYIVLGIITGFTLFGFSYHLYIKGISVNPDNTMLSQLAGEYFGQGILYQIIIWVTFIVLILAANSTFTGFPQLSAIVAADGYLPRALTNRGDRLGYSNGIILLAGVASILIEVFQAQTNALIPLYAIGVFLSFTVAQIGLCKRWHRMQGKLWKLKFIVNLVGAVMTSTVTIIFALTKFADGAWIVLIVLPLLIFLSISIQKHYAQIAGELHIDTHTMQPSPCRVATIVLVSGIHRVVYHSVSFAKSLDSNTTALYIGFDENSMINMRQKWEEWGNPCKLIALKSDYRSVLEPLSRYIKKLEAQENGPDQIHIVLSQFIQHKWWHNLLHNQTAFLIRAWLMRNKDVIITTVPYHLKH